MSHNIKTKQKVYGMGDEPMVGKDWCEGEMPDEYESKNVNERRKGLSAGVKQA